MKILKVIGVLFFFSVSACAPNKVLFVTKTSLSILDVDTKPASTSIAYDRVEGYFGPSYDNGAVPPVCASIESDGKIFNPVLKQRYATGNAAVLLAGGNKLDSRVDLSGEKRFMFFGTSTTTGLKIGFTDKIPDSFLFGFKRKEISFIQIGQTPKLDKNGKQITDKKGKPVMVDHYPSVIASIDTGAESGIDSTGRPIPANLKNNQIFATGFAAEALAPYLAPSFQEKAKNAFGVYRQSVTKQKLAAGGLIVCYPGVQVQDRPKVWKDADRLGLFHDDPDAVKTYDKLMKAYKEVIDINGQVLDQNRLARIDRAYVTAIYTPDGFDPSRNKLLEVHEKTVCDLSRNNKK